MKLHEILAKRAEVLASMEKLNNDNPQMSEDVEVKYNTLNDEFKALTRQLDIAQAKQDVDSTPADLPLAQANTAATPVAVVNMLAYARTGVIEDPKNAMQTGGSTKGAYLIPDTYATSILTGLSKESVLRKHADVMVTNGTYNMPIAGTKATFGWIDELGSYPKTESTFDNKTIEAWKAGGIIQVSEELLNDEKYNLEAHLREQIVEGLASHEAEAFFIGDGVKKPLGMTESIVAENKSETSATDIITLTDVETLFLTPKAGYRKKGVFIISDKFFKAIFRMKNANGEYIWTPSTTEDEPGKIFGRSYEIDDSLLGGAGEPLAYFGDMNAYKIGDRGQMAIQRLSELYAENGMVGFKVFKRTDGKLAHDDAIAVLNNKA